MADDPDARIYPCVDCGALRSKNIKGKRRMSRVETIGDATLYLGDCREILPAIGQVDAVITDPPYGIGIAANPVRQRHEKLAWDDRPAPGDLIAQVRATAPLSIIWGGNYFNLPPTQCFLIWDKVQPEGLTLSQCEMAWTSMSKPAKLFRRHVVSYTKEHPTQKPTELMKWCVLQLPPKVSIIADPFMGSGTTGVAALSLGRKFIGIETDLRYFDIACRRAEEASKQTDMIVLLERKAEEIQAGLDLQPRETFEDAAE